MLRRFKVGILVSGIAVALAAAQAPAYASGGSAAGSADTAASSVYITSDPTVGGRFFCGGAYDAGTYNCEDVITFGNVV